MFKLLSSLRFVFNPTWLAALQKVFCVIHRGQRSDSSVGSYGLSFGVLQWKHGGLAQGMQLKKAE